MTTDFQRPNFRNSSLTFPPKKCESLLGNCGENRLQSIGNEKSKKNKAKTTTENKKKNQDRDYYVFHLLLSLLSFHFLFLFLLCSVILAGAFPRSRNLYFGLRGFHLNDCNFH